MSRTTLLLSLGMLVTALASAAELDHHGCRVLSKLPARGVHPRVFFTADEYPLMRKRLESRKFKAAFSGARAHMIGQARGKWSELARADMSNPTDADIVKYFTSGEMRNQMWGVASVTAVLTEDRELLDIMKGVVTNYARIILASRERALGGGGKAKPAPELAKALKIWKTSGYDVGVSWTFGAAGYAVAFDVLYNDMSPEERAVVTKAIAAATKGRKSYGNGMPRGFAVSNHYGYHGDLAALLAVIEDEEGFDREAWDGIVQVLRDYWEISFTRAGVSHEDGYGPNLGMRGGGRGLMVLARRGYNIFATRKYRNYLDYVAMDYDPYPGGHLNGGASGGPYGELYPTSTILGRYMYPRNVSANFCYRHLAGDDFKRKVRWQGWLDFFLYGADWKGEPSREKMLAGSGLPLSVYYPERGKLVARSDWTSDAMYVTFDARPDAHSIGHDKVDRGNFSMSALGRVWAFTGDFHQYEFSRENSLVHIDGKAEAWKAPSVRFMWHEHGWDIAGGGADLKYAYDWQWTPPWPKWGQKYDAPWEPETRGPIDLGWPKAFAIPELPKSLHGSETGYAGTNNLHRRPYNKVEKAQRSVHLVRGTRPYTIVCDDIRKDAKPHLYEWYMQLPVDLKVKSSKTNEVVLAEADADGGREMLVRFLQEAQCSTRVEEYEAAKDKRGKVTRCKRLIASAKCVEPKFRVILIPYRAGQALPTTSWNRDRTVLTVTFADHVDVLEFRTTEKEGTRIGFAK